MKRIFCVIICVIICVGLCGCNLSIFDTDNLLSPPQLRGELYPIQKALVESINGDYTLKYPSNGEIKSSVVTDDLNGDGIKEAFAFYSTTDNDETTMHLNLITKDEKEYKSVYDSTITASGIDKIEFSDLDNDGKKEIIVGWEIYAESEKKLAVYSFDSDALTQLMLERYTNFLCLDLDNNGKNEIFIQDLDTKQSVNKASIYSLLEKGVSQIAGCLLDGKVKSVSKIELSSLSNGQPAVYIDEIKGIGAVTEVLFISKGELKNPLLDSVNTMENIKTIRPSTIGFADINQDGIIEIPVASDMPLAESSSTERLYYTNWCSFGGEALTVKQVLLVNAADGYSVNIPKRFIGGIAASKNSDKRIRTIYYYDNEVKQVGAKLISIKTVDKSDFEKNPVKNDEYTRVFKNDSVVIIAQIEDKQGEKTITKEELKNIISFNNF